MCYVLKKRMLTGGTTASPHLPIHRSQEDCNDHSLNDQGAEIKDSSSSHDFFLSFFFLLGCLLSGKQTNKK